ncbi:hypothetical protein S7711_05843 [Stachybotrys chartarum IBT 7711]|uniref:Uncharacterized protein n=1 Tax=Stachybotrys chartarum (strain CBS 109288 / IBT 7711) TaxID=1280523 RepID=A0A084AM81_STACB|nr:hypothetical protein S7711_05843 [Stachybotrys chartarum IBT 7711]
MEPIAIVGSGCRFPGRVSSPSELWDLLEAPRDLLSKIPPSRFNPEGHYHEDGEHHGSSNVKHAYLLDDDHRVFDNNFFGIPRKEAESMDPQQRIILETVYESIESAGYSIQKLRGSDTAVYLGIMNNDFLNLMMRDLDCLPQYFATGAGISIMANRISYFFDWKGPSVALDTACSSSLVALNHAVQVLRSGDSAMAIAAGVNLILGPEPFIYESKLHMLSSSGGSRMWDQSADGYTRGDGFAAVVLKTLTRALADGDDIECIIRITMPSAEAQASLIRSTYAKCGLDLRKAADRPQYFEAHGTGTPVGDPTEAEAIQRVFFPLERGNDISKEELLVGSIKTVIGHTEGTAGLAGLLKASLALQHGIVPPNLHFNQLNPKVLPFYDNLRVPVKAMPWPSMHQGVCRRASVNSFGFGGTNAHAILESWPRERQSSSIRDGIPESNPFVGGMFVLSADTSKALSAMAAMIAKYLRLHPDTNLSDLSYTLWRRGGFSFKASFSATNPAELIDKLESIGNRKISRAPTIPQSLPLRILGVFTGQGAQWTGMGIELVAASSSFRNSLAEMQRSLDELPDRPEWTLIGQLTAPAETSRIHQAAISQPLCTALQVALIDLLRTCGISFSATVGHSSGEIAAAYAANMLSARSAIRIAFYRGLHAKLAQGPEAQQGRMMAVGMSLDHATKFCKEFFAGKITVAASNSRLSCTLSGDEDAVDHARKLLEGQQIFTRMLKIDTAYHSHHMQPCAGPYLESMKNCGIVIPEAAGQCIWYSSVYGLEGRSRSISDEGLLDGQYWVDNMTHAVLFNQAVYRAITEEHCHDLVLEVGPHPSLRGPCSETINELVGRELPYSGILKRGENAVNSFIDALGFVWEKFVFPSPLISFEGVRRAFLVNEEINSVAPVLLKDAPSYVWDHNNVIWMESRKSKAFRIRSTPSHELLGHATALGEKGRPKHEMRWRQVLKLDEMPWARGHVFQGQVLFPAAGYVVMAYEAARRLLDNSQPVRFVELQDLEIIRAITLDEQSAGTEMTFVIRITDHKVYCVTAEYRCYSGPIDATVDGDDAEGDKINFTGRVEIVLGQPESEGLPARVASPLPMKPLDIKRLYKFISETGLEYSGDFRVDYAERRLNQASVTLKRPGKPSPLRIHPATLDAAFQSVFAAFSYPGDGRHWAPYLPTGIGFVRFNEPCCKDGHTAPSSLLTADAFITEGSAKVIKGDVSIFCGVDGHADIQIIDFTCTCLAAPSPADDRELYGQHVWIRDIAEGIEPSQRATPLHQSNEKAYVEIIERAAYFYCRTLKDAVDPAELEVLSIPWHMRHFMKWLLDYILPQIESGQHLYVRPEWSVDTAEMVKGWQQEYSDRVDMRLLCAMGEILPDIVRGIVPPLEIMMQDDMLHRLYVEALGCREINNDAAVVVGQLAHQYPHMKILEIGAGTGGVTRGILDTLKGQFASYTYTDISAGFFAAAQETFTQYGERMIFKTLNIEQAPKSQGYAEGTYDLIIAANVLHATRWLGATLKNCQKMLRPGGRMVLLELTNEPLYWQLLMGTLPGWFLGVDDGRVWAPTVSLARWHHLLVEAGFSGIDSESTSYASVLVTQSLDEEGNTLTLREPLAAPKDGLPCMAEIVVVGDDNLTVVGKIRDFLAERSGQFSIVSSLNDIVQDGIQVPYGAVVMCLSDLTEPAFNSMNEQRFRGIQEIMRKAGTLLWVTHGAKANNPTANMMIGLGRSILMEMPELQLQFVDLDQPEAANAAMLASMLIRLVCLGKPEFGTIMWSNEHELAIEDGAVYLPRVKPNTVLNQRSNASQRAIVQQASLRETSVELTEVNGALQLHASPSVDNPQDLRVRVEIAVSSAFGFTTCDGAPRFLSIGSVVSSGRRIIVLCPSNQSVALVNEEDVLDWPVEAREDEAQLLRLVSTIMAESILVGVQKSIWIHDTDDLLGQAIENAARCRDVDVLFTSSVAKSTLGRKFLHPYATGPELHRILPSTGIEVFMNLEEQQPGLPKLDDLVRRSTSATVLQFPIRREDGKMPFFKLAYRHSDLKEVMKRHRDTLGRALERSFLLDSASRMTQMVNVDQIKMFTTKTLHPLTIIDWRSTVTVSLRVRGLQHDRLFSPCKTYLLVGLTGDLGLSICEWMVGNGVRYIAMSSRNPRVHQGFVEYLERRGAVLRVFAFDISNENALRLAYQQVCDTMPPVGGVMNGAMVLKDRAFLSTTWEEFDSAMSAKVQGSRNLDNLFRDTSLDFFIMFSSVASVFGNKGQSSYGAANLFMTSLAEQRRQRGFAASVVHISVLLGFGYIARVDQAAADRYESWLIQQSIVPLGETDLHNMLAEAIVCGRQGSGYSTEIVTGLDKTERARWRNDPRLAFYLKAVDEVGSEKLQQFQVHRSSSVKDLLAEASDEDMALAVLEECFGRAIGAILQVDADGLDHKVPITNLGIDSLVAVQIRSWFMKEVGADIPVLKVLAENSLQDLCREALAGRRHVQGQAQEQNGLGSVVTETAASGFSKDWDWDAELTSILAEIPHMTPTIPEENGDSTCGPHELSDAAGFRVLLTGATGFVGRSILSRLVASNQVKEVHCIAIRPRSNGSPRNAGMKHDKLIEYCGDLTAPLLGLSTVDFTMLSRRADVIIHNAAEVSFIKDYQALREINVLSTQKLLAMAFPRQIPIHFISTAAVALLQSDTDDTTALPEISAAHLRPRMPDERIEMGYVASKWASEVLLERSGVPAVIHRASMILGEGAPTTDLMTVVDRYSEQMGAVPSLDQRHLRGVVDIVQVGDVAEAVVAASIDPATRKSFNICHHCNGDSFRIEDLQKYYEEKTGHDIAVWSKEKWLDRAVELGLGSLIATFLRQQLQGNEAFRFVPIRKGRL